ncbi:hypothetical protein [Pimelobacter simplex]|uniref:hypothetical protein n=1 Tax=Nocardioides simplex TaxID=2045 RepID=UPI0021501C3B|nr:hypothetical protein [Pimelobacter simplex]UUW92664.1 hypothetical protein M0M43_14630 [Pimelobacter simplex]UUW96492.1 hypothetical protein M0M48_03265 [Pimelobacter simplex]
MKTTNAVVLAIAAGFVTIVAAAAVVFVVEPDAATEFVTPLLTFAGTTFAVIAGLASVGRKQDEQRRQLDDVSSKVEYLANGGTDAKVRAGVADVIRSELLDPKAAEQIAADRAHREAGPAGSVS